MRIMKEAGTVIVSRLSSNIFSLRPIIFKENRNENNHNLYRQYLTNYHMDKDGEKECRLEERNSWDEARGVAYDRAGWRGRVAALCTQHN